MLVNDFVMSCIDYCNVLLAGGPKATSDKLQHLLNAAPLLVSDMKFDRGLSQLMHVDLHWLVMLGQVEYKLVSMVHNCVHRKAAQDLMDCCILISDMVRRRHLHFAKCNHLVVPRHNLSTYGRQAFAVAGLAA